MSSLYAKYEKSTITKFDIIGSYFVGIYYNELYLKAEQLRNEGKYDSLTHSYQQVLYNYIQFTQNKDFFRKTILGIHNYFISTTKFVSMTYKECIDFIVGEFIPTHLFENVKETQKYNILNNILIDCLKIFTEKILQTQMGPIIDNHYEQANIHILQNIYLEIILLEKDKMYARFINPEKRNHTIPTELYNNIQQQFKKLTESNLLLTKQNTDLQNELFQLKKNAEQETNKLKELGLQVINQNKQLQQELQMYKNRVQTLENSNNSLLTRQSNSLSSIDDKPPVSLSSIDERPNIEIKSSPLSTTYNKYSDLTRSNNSYNDTVVNINKSTDIPIRNHNTQNTITNSNNEISEITHSPKNDIEKLQSDNELMEDSTTIKILEGNMDDNLGKTLIKREVNDKHNEFLNELNSDDDVMDEFTNIGGSGPQFV